MRILNVAEEIWDEILEGENAMAHGLRALIVIARGRDTRLQWIVEQNIRAVIDGNWQNSHILEDDPTMQTEAYKKLYGRAEINPDQQI